MENKIDVRTDNSPSGLSSLTAEAATSRPNGDAFSAALACHSRTNPFKGQWGDDSKDMFENLVRQFGDELKDTKSDGRSEPPGSARRSYPLKLCIFSPLNILYAACRTQQSNLYLYGIMGQQDVLDP